jgi:hypothetical protein
MVSYASGADLISLVTGQVIRGDIFADPPAPFGERFWAYLLKNGDVEAITGGPNPGIRHWDSTFSDFGIQQVAPGAVAPNGRLFGNSPTGGGMVTGTNAASVGTIVFDDQFDTFTFGGSFSGFPTGSAVVSAFRETATGPVFAITNGTPGNLWRHTGTGNPTLVGPVGNTPLDVNCVGVGGLLVGVVTNNGSDSITIFTDDGNAATIRGTFPVGDGPVFVDLRVLPGTGIVEILTTGELDDTIRRSTFDTSALEFSGGDVRDTTLFCTSPTYAGFAVADLAAEDPEMRVVCHDINRVFRAATAAFFEADD